MPRNRAPEIGWVFFLAANLAAMVLFPHQAAIPFHFIWISLMLMYGLRVWSLPATFVTLGLVLAMTTVALLPHILAENNWFEFSESPLMAGVFLVMVGFARRREAALHAVKRASAREREFLRDASHQLRTPIAVARGHAELIVASDATVQVREDADIVLDELGSLQRISDRLLLLAAAEQHDFLSVEPVDIEDLLVHMLRRWSAAADRSWQLAVDEATVLADRERLEAALDALIENAVRVTEPGDEITLASRVGDSGVTLEVLDSGPGVDPDHLPHLFDRFYHVTGSNTSGSRGTGLGLALVRAIAEAHGGTASAQSILGRGALFRLHLPAGAADDRGDAPTTLIPQFAESV
jgi:signal transduction histidine kinase